MSDEMQLQIAELQRKIALVGGMPATVKSYDGNTHKAVVDFNGFDTHEIQVADLNGCFNPLSPGQQVTVMCPAGDLANAFILGGGYSGSMKPPSNRSDENVMAHGDGKDRGVFRARKGGVARVEGASRQKIKLIIGGQAFCIKAEALEPTSLD